MATQNRAGASTQPYLTPEVVTKRCYRSWPSRTCAPVFSCRLMIKSSRVSGTPLPRRAFHSASLSTESKAALMLRYATFNGRSNSRWSSDKRRKARMASIVDRPATKPDCSGRRVASSSGWRRASRTCAKTLPGTESKVIGLQLLHSVLAPFPLYSATNVPSLQSGGRGRRSRPGRTASVEP